MQRPFSQQKLLSGKQHWNDLCRPLKEFFPSCVIACYKYCISCRDIFHCTGVQCSKFVGKSNWRPKCIETFPFTLCTKLFIRSAFGIPFMCRRFIICLFCYSLCRMFFCSQSTVDLHSLVIHINEGCILPSFCWRGCTKPRDITNFPHQDSILVPPELEPGMLEC